MTETKPHLVFEVDRMSDGGEQVQHAQCVVPYSIKGRDRQASIESKQQMQHYDTRFCLVHSIRRVRKRRGDMNC